MKNVLRHPERESGKAGKKLKEQRRAAFKSPSDSSYSQRIRLFPTVAIKRFTIKYLFMRQCSN